MLSKETGSVVYQGGDDTSVFPVPFPFLETSHVKADMIFENDAELELSHGDYMVTRNAVGTGEIVLLGAPLQAGRRLRVRRAVPFTQEKLMANQGGYYPQATEEALDKLTMLCQQLRDVVDRALLAPDGTSPAEAVTSLVGVKERISEMEGAAAALATRTDTLAAEMDGTVKKNDIRLSDARQPLAHAKTHTEGSDLIRARDIGALTAPPGDGKAYLATATGWVLFEGGDGGDGGNHALLSNRDAADQHPQSAIQHLETDLDTIRDDIAAKADSAALDAKADADHAHGAATQSTAGFLSAGDKKKLDDLAAGGGEPSTPVGAIIPYGGVAAPANWLLCDGALLAKGDFPELYAAIGNTFGKAGDGDATKFRLPDLRGRVPLGAGHGEGLTTRSAGQFGGDEEHTLTVSEMPSHNHPYGSYGLVNMSTSGSTYFTAGSGRGASVSLSNAGGGQAHNNMQPWVAANFIIKARSGGVESSADFSSAIAAVNGRMDMKLERFDYSPDERDTGCRWTDGKKIWRRTINFGMLPNVAWKTVAHGIANINEVISYDGFAYGPAQQEYAKYISIHNYVTLVGVGASSIGVYCSTNFNAYSASHITLYYTCTDR